MADPRFKSVKEFYPFYLSEHQNTTNRLLHFIGTGLVVLSVFTGILFHEWRFIIATPVLAYGFAWIGHHFFEQNKSSVFKFPIFNIVSDFMLFWDLLSGNRPFRDI